MGRLSGSASTEIDAPLEEVWAVVEDVMAAPEWQGSLESVTALEHDRDGRPTLVDTNSDIVVRRVRSRCRISYEGPTRLAWSQEDGDMKSVEAVWELEDLGDGRTRVRYSFNADPGRMMGLVIRGPMVMATRAIVVNGRPGELKRRVEEG